jgi:hypothetical protein
LDFKAFLYEKEETKMKYQHLPLVDFCGYETCMMRMNQTNVKKASVFCFNTDQDGVSMYCSTFLPKQAVRCPNRWHRIWVMMSLICLLFGQVGAVEAAVRSRPVSSTGAIEIEVTDNGGISSIYVYQEGQLQGKVKKISPELFKEYVACPNKVTLSLEPGKQHLHKHRIVYGSCGKKTQVNTYVTPASNGIGLIDPVPEPWTKGTLQPSIVPRK